MKIGIDYRPALGEFAGIGYYCQGLIEGLSKLKIENTFYLYIDKELPRDHLNFGKRIIKNHNLFHPGVLSDLALGRIDLFHSTHSLIVPSFSKKTVVTIHDISALTFQDAQRKAKIISKLLLIRAIRNTQKIIVPSKATKEEILKLTPLERTKIVVIPEAADNNFYPRSEKEIKFVREKYNLAKNYILFNATIEPRKNVLRLIHAYNYLRKNKKITEELVLIGKPGWGYGSGLEIIKNLNLTDQIKLLGWVKEDDLPALYSGAKIFVYPSLQEGFGLSILKAFKTQIPVAVSNIEVLKEICADAAVFFDPYRIESIAESIFKLLKNNKLANELIKKGEGRVKNYSFEKMARATFEVYQSVLK